MEGKEGYSSPPIQLEARCIDKQVPADSLREGTSTPVRAWLVKSSENHHGTKEPTKGDGQTRIRTGTGTTP